jgi:hypothetical protein
MKSKIFGFIILGMFLLNFASAIAVYSGFNGDYQSLSVTIGDTVNFDADFISMYPPINSMTIELYPEDSSTPTYTFLDTSTTNRTHSQAFTYTTDTVGTFEIIAIGTDSISTDSNTLTLTVLAPNNAPVLNAVGDRTTNEGVSLTFTISATDADSSDVLTYTASGLPTGASFDSSTRTFSWTPSTNQVGSHSITFGVSDGRSGTDSETITITVVDTTAPVITLLGSNPITVEAGDTYSDSGAIATDNSGETITPTITANTVNMSTVGTYSVTYTAIDSTSNSATATRTVNVVDTTAPVITFISDQTIDEDDSYTYQVAVVDYSPLTYTISGASWLSISSTGLISGTSPKLSADKDYTITITVSDGPRTSTDSFVLTVEDTAENKKGSDSSSSTSETIFGKRDEKTSTNDISTLNLGQTKENAYGITEPLIYALIGIAVLGVAIIGVILFKRLRPVKVKKEVVKKE